MNGILHLIRRDARQAFRNVMAGIVMFGLIVIPALFTWFNVLASWDPFANTSQLKVAVASTDEGYQGDLVPLRVNVGEQVLSELRANDRLDWVITSEDDAIDGTKAGRYYAAIVLPKTFSADMLTFYSDGAQRTALQYYTNQKKNALAPKITDQGAEGVSAQITEVFTEKLGEVALGLVSSLSDYLTAPDAQAAVAKIESRVSGVATQLRAGAQTADMFTTLVAGTIPLVDSSAALVSSSRDAFSDAADAIGSGGAAVDGLVGALGSTSAALDAALTSAARSYDAVAAAVDELYARIDDLSADQTAVIGDLAARVQQQIDATNALRTTLVDDIRPGLPPAGQAAVDRVASLLDQAIARQQGVHDSLQDAATGITDANAGAQAAHAQVTALIAQAQQAFQDAADAYTGTLRPQLDLLAGTLASIESDVAGIRGDLSSAADGLSGSAGSARAALTDAQAATQKLANSLRSSADRFDTLQQKLQTAGETGDFSGLSAIIGSDPATVAASLAEPVRVDRVAIFPVVSFGAAMTPLYLILALWVGALLMTVAIRVDVTASTLPGFAELSPTQNYLGRYGVFALTGLAQSTLVTLGLILFIGIQPAHPFLLIVAGWMSSIVFTLIIYTFVVAFGNAGKALAVLLLVIQISGSGGAYPLQLLPPWFQGISPFLPATHAIAAVRAAIAGMYGADFWVEIGLLAVFAVPTLLLGLVLRRPLMSFNRGLMEALESTKLM